MKLYLLLAFFSFSLGLVYLLMGWYSIAAIMATMALLLLWRAWWLLPRRKPKFITPADSFRTWSEQWQEREEEDSISRDTSIAVDAATADAPKPAQQSRSSSAVAVGSNAKRREPGSNPGCSTPFTLTSRPDRFPDKWPADKKTESHCFSSVTHKTPKL